MYAPFDVPRLLGRPLELSFTRDSGVAGLVFLIKQHTGREPAKDDPGMQALHRELLRQFESGRQTAVEWEEIEGLLGAAVV
jgi:2-phosphinomethylmalic acid synthase